jgi:hypothetical protein
MCFFFVIAVTGGWATVTTQSQGTSPRVIEFRAKVSF